MASSWDIYNILSIWRIYYLNGLTRIQISRPKAILNNFIKPIKLTLHKLINNKKIMKKTDYSNVTGNP